MNRPGAGSGVSPPCQTTLSYPSANPHGIVGEWTLEDAVGEFPYRIEVGERHLSIESDATPKSLAIELFLDHSGEPWRIQHSMTTMLEDEDVLLAIDDTENARLVKDLQKVQRTAILVAALMLIAIPVTWMLSSDSFNVHPLVLLVGSFACLVVSIACDMSASRVGHRHAYLTRRKKTKPKNPA